MDQGQGHHHHQEQLLRQQLHSQVLSPLQHQQNLQHLQHDSTPQDVLAEARKNLQVLIDNGLSKDLLHQLVDGGQTLQLQLNLPTLPVPSQPSLIPPQPTLAPPPPPPQCPPPPPPMQVSTTPVSSSIITTGGLLSPSAASSTSSSAASSHSTASTPIATTPTPDIKAESVPEDLTISWTQAPACVLTSPADDASIFLPPSAPFSHRPRISVSSTSSGSSGHASIWSSHSAQSTMSWQSASTAPRNQAPLPMPPTNATSTGGPLINGAQVASGTAASKQNIYWCTSCETSFKRKYDWKRHEDEFHERWRKYPCPEPGCNRSFWGSNSFNQHHKQCHGCKTCPHAEKVVKFLRKRKYWACGFCSALHPARERHVEHVARHFESGMTKGDWMHSRVVYGLLHQPLIHEAWDALVATKQAEYAGRRPQFSWHPSKTGRAQGFLEKESPGQLQDLLEFFSGDEGEAQWIVSVAYDLADIVLTTAPVQSPQFAQPNMSQHPFPSQDPRMSFSTLPTQAQQQHQHQQHQHQQHQQQQQQLLGSPFRNTIFVPSQAFPQTQHSSPGSTSHSAHSPMAPSHSPLDKRELPPPPPSSMSEPATGLMDFEYLSAPMVLDDWESIASSITGESAPPQMEQPQQGWGMPQYYNDPRISS